MTASIIETTHGKAPHLSVRLHRAPRDISIPPTGGRCVTDLNMGTKRSPPMPVAKTRFCPRGFLDSTFTGAVMGLASPRRSHSIPTVLGFRV